jgi:serine/threonine protein phosphatase 1
MLLAGNHEQVLLEALDTGDLRAFLKMGGAATIKSYHGGSVGPDVLTNFVASIPPRHLQSLRAMPSRFELPGLLAQHHPPTPPLPNCYTISAHAQVGPLPRIGPQAAELDTGCGTPGGRLTAMLWPCRGILQVDEKGVPVT